MRITVRNSRTSPVRVAGRTFRPRSSTPLDVDEATADRLAGSYGLTVDRPVSQPALGRPADAPMPTGTGGGRAMSHLPEGSDAAEAADPLACPAPGCDMVAKSAIGLASHVRAKHKEI